MTPRFGTEPRVGNGSSVMRKLTVVGENVEATNQAKACLKDDQCNIRPP